MDTNAAGGYCGPKGYSVAIVNCICFAIGCYGFLSDYILDLHPEEYDPRDYVLSRVWAWLLCSMLVIKLLKLLKWIHHNVCTIVCTKAEDECDEVYRRRLAERCRLVGYLSYFVIIVMLASASLKSYLDCLPVIAVSEESEDVETASHYLTRAYFFCILYACGFLKMILYYLIQHEPDLPGITTKAWNRLWINISNWFLFSIVSAILSIATWNNLPAVYRFKLPENEYLSSERNIRLVFLFSMVIFEVIFSVGLIAMATSLAVYFSSQTGRDSITSVDERPTDSRVEELNEPSISLEQQIAAVMQRMYPSVSQLFSSSGSQSKSVYMEMTERPTSTSRLDRDVSETSQNSPIQELTRTDKAVIEKSASTSQPEKDVSEMFQAPILKQNHQNIGRKDRPKLQRQDAFDNQIHPSDKQPSTSTPV